MSAAPHAQPDPSAWIRRWTHLVPAGGTVLDVACGHGRHMRWFARHGHPVTGIDRDADALASAADAGRTIAADIEDGPWPLEGETFAGVVVTNYLWRALLPRIVASVADGGLLLYETFAQGNETVGKPSRPDFLLRSGELLQACAGCAWSPTRTGSCMTRSDSCSASPPCARPRPAGIRVTRSS